jgi:ribonuclease III
VTPSTTSSPSWAEALDTAVSLRPLEGRLGHSFADLDLIALALTHGSWCAEHPGESSNERLEFLGDAVLGLVVTHELYVRFPDLPEGHLSRVRAAVVSESPLAAVGRHLGIGAALRLGKGEDGSGGRDKPSILSDAVEAVIGAVYLDGGAEAARRVVLDLLGERIDEAARAPGMGDFKSRLQELAARDGAPPPVYRVHQSGPHHDSRFHAVVEIGGVVRGEGDGRSKKEAEQQAARRAWQDRVDRLGDEGTR